MRGFWPTFVTLSLLVTPLPVGAQSLGDLSTAPLPEEIRNALARTPEEATVPSPQVLQEGPIDPASYRLGAGDELTVYYTGRTSLTHRLVVSPEGDVYLPDVGTVSVAGRSLADGKERIRAAARKILKDVRVDVSLTRLRVFKVSLGGEVRVPGVYAATAVTRVHELIREARGLTDSAAVRSMRLDGKGTGGDVLVDLLPFLLTGRTEGSNPYVMDGQGLFVPRRARLVRVSGAVLHPGTYDLPDTMTTVKALLDLVGLAPDAALERIELVRTSGAAQGGLAIIARASTVADGGVGLSAIGNTPLEHGNQVLVPHIGGFARTDVVSIDGEVRYPGDYSIGDKKTTVEEAVQDAGGFTPEAVPARVRLVRPITNRQGESLPPIADHQAVELTATEKEMIRSRGIGDYRAVVVNLSGARTTDGRSAGPVLVPGDRILVPRAGSFVEVTGRVKRPGFYAFDSGRSAVDYVDDAGGYAARADRRNIRIAAGPGDNFLLAKDAGPPQPGDRVWVPERTPRSTWATTKDLLLVLGQVATIFIVIDQAGKN